MDGGENLKEGHTMKVYLFDTQNGLFAGETFEDPDMLQYEEGITPVPPPEFEHGQVPVFDRQINEWTVIPLTIAKQLLQIQDAKTESKS
jgi:hypothetical protein